ncbi:MAG: dephospho-CoA kinase [Bacteroidales bacterium]|nr:dephospho-CoA kinase [Bacteroidales bacterium]
MKTVILTGGMGSGKSAVARYLRSCGVPAYDSDARTKSLYDRDPSLVPLLEKELGVSLRDASGRLDRKRLASRIFPDPSAKARLEALVYPAVLADFRRWKRWHRPAGWTYGPVPFVVLESAVILSHPIFDGIGDRVVLVDAPEPVRLQRCLSRDGSTPEEALRRIRSQSFDLSRVDAILDNGGPVGDIPARSDRVFLNLFTIFAS